jgi:hypothetical protein
MLAGSGGMSRYVKKAWVHGIGNGAAGATTWCALPFLWAFTPNIAVLALGTRIVCGV